MELLSYPFRLSPIGRVATVTQGSAEAAAEEIAQLVLTEPGERPLVPEYGINDPTFGRIDVGDIAAAVQIWGPGVAVTGAETKDDSTTETMRVTQRVRITFEG